MHIQEVVGFTDNQRKWFHQRDGGRCQFRWFNGLRWVQCSERVHLEVHHRIPRGWAMMHMPKNFSLNGSMNGIVLCQNHHRGQKSVHPDTFLAQKKYNGGNKKAFDEMMQERAKLNQRGQPYWVTRWDWMFERVIRKNTLKFIRAHPYPVNGNRGNTGRIQPSY